MLVTARLLALIPHAAAAAHESLQPTAAPLASRDWPQMGRTPSFESTSNVSVSGAPHAEWTFKGATSRLISSPAVYDGIVYVGCDDGHLYALEVNTGRQLWAFAQSCMPATAEKCGGNGIRSSPAVASDGSVAFGSYDGHAYKVDKMGKLLWQYKVPKPIYSPATIDSDGTVYVGTMRGDNCLYAINGDSGKLKWKACGERLFGEMNSGAAIGAPGGPAADIVVVNNFDKNIRAFDRPTGKLVWLHKVGGPSGGSATIVGSTAYIGSWDRNFYALDIHTGSVKWVFPAKGEIESHPAYADGIVYITAEESRALFAINASTGTQIWNYTGPTEEVNGSPTITPTLVFAGANDGFMHAVHRSTGTLAFKVAMPEDCPHVFSSAAVDGKGMVYFTCNTAGPGIDSAEGEDFPSGVGILFSINPTLHMEG